MPRGWPEGDSFLLEGDTEKWPHVLAAPGPCRVTFTLLLGPRALGGFACLFAQIKKVISAAWDCSAWVLRIRGGGCKVVGGRSVNIRQSRGRGWGFSKTLAREQSLGRSLTPKAGSSRRWRLGDHFSPKSGSAGEDPRVSRVPPANCSSDFSSALQTPRGTAE